MNSKDIIQILKSEPDKFTYAEIEQMMDEELEKDPSEMDTDFVDLCADVLIKALSEHKEKDRKQETHKDKDCKNHCNRRRCCCHYEHGGHCLCKIC